MDEIVSRVADATGLSKRVVRQVIGAVPGAVVATLAQQGRVRWRGLGTWEVRHWEARTGRDPRTGKSIRIPARSHVRFHAARPALEALRELEAS